MADDPTTILCAHLVELAQRFAAGERHWSVLRDMGHTIGDIASRHIEEIEAGRRPPPRDPDGRVRTYLADEVGEEELRAQLPAGGDVRPVRRW